MNLLELVEPVSSTLLLGLEIVFFEPTDKRKADKPLLKKHRITMTFPNLKELRAMANSVSKIAMTPNADIFDEILVLGTSLSQLIDCIVVTIGAKGLVVITNNLGVHSAKHYYIEAISSPVNVSGAGDCFASGFIHGFLSGFTEDRCVTIGLEAAKAALLTEKTVPHNFKLNEKLFASKFKELLC